jgi:hypothetical protein
MTEDNKQVCVAGWYFFEDFYNKLSECKYDISIVAHKDNSILNKFSNHIVINNIGLEFHMYDYFIKNMWNGTSDVIFMQDDIFIKNLKFFEDAFVKCDGFDCVYIFGKWDKLQDVHGRCIYLSRKSIESILNDGGVWFDETNTGQIEGGGKTNWGIKRFRDKIIALNLNSRSFQTEFMTAFIRGKPQEKIPINKNKEFI